jgi:hypothetical protein
MRKKNNLVDTKNQENIKAKETENPSSENVNPNIIENIELYDLATKPPAHNRLAYKK